MCSRDLYRILNTLTFTIKFNLTHDTFVTESIVDCGPPPDVINATYTLSDGTVEGSVATYSCIAGFRLARTRENSLTCSDSGDWRGTMPRCRGRHVQQCTRGIIA